MFEDKIETLTNSRILDALRGAHPVVPPRPTFDDVAPGQPFKWAVENRTARNGVCIKLKCITGEIGFSWGAEKYGWTPLENSHAGTIYPNREGSKEVIPL